MKSVDHTQCVFPVAVFRVVPWRRAWGLEVHISHLPRATRGGTLVDLLDPKVPHFSRKFPLVAPREMRSTNIRTHLDALWCACTLSVPVLHYPT